MKKIIMILTPITIIISITFFVLFSFVFRHDGEETEFFKKYQSDFELITEYIIDNYDTQTKDSLGVYWENGTVYLYDDHAVLLDRDLRNAFDNILNAFKNYEFSFVDITPERISYGGLGCRMYVYSRNGKAPDYFYYEGDAVNEDCFYLGDNWYLLMYYRR